MRYRDLAPPIPQSNSDAAKQMRCALIMASLARAIDAHIFQPTYFLSADSGIRNLLTRQAQDESRKESAVRALIQAMLPKEQDTVATSRVAQACGDVMQDVGGLLPSEAERTFKERVTDIAEEARDIWREIQRSKYAVEPNFVLRHYYDWSWQQVRFDGNNAVFVDGSQSTNGMDEPLFTIFPRFYISDEEGQEPVTHGVLFMRSQTLEARRELEQEPPSPRAGRSNSILTRLQRPRKVSPGTPTNNNEESRSFLDQRSSDKHSHGQKDT